MSADVEKYRMGMKPVVRVLAREAGVRWAPKEGVRGPVAVPDRRDLLARWIMMRSSLLFVRNIKNAYRCTLFARNACIRQNSGQNGSLAPNGRKKKLNEIFCVPVESLSCACIYLSYDYNTNHTLL